MTDKELDQLLKSKLAGKTYPYNPANWKAMEAMLNQAQAPSTPLYWRQTAAILLLTLLLAIPLLWQNVGDAPLPAPAINQPVSNTSPAAKDQPRVNEQTGENSGRTPADAQEPAVVTNSEPKASNTVASEIQNQSTESSPAAAAIASAESGSGNRAAVAEASPTSREQPIYLAVSNKQTQNLPAHYSFARDLRPQTQSEAPAFAPTIDPRALAKFDNRHEISLQAGPSVNQAYSSQTGAGWQLGVHYRYRATANLALSTSLNYVRTGDMGISTTADSVFFGFGRTEVRTEKHYRQISSIRVPLKAEYTISPKHMVTGGAFADVVTAIQMDLQKTTTPYKADPRVENHSSAKRRNEFSNVNYGATLGYFYRYDPRLSFGLNINYSLTDLTNDNYQKFEGDHRLLQSELVIRYRLF